MTDTTWITLGITCIIGLGVIILTCSGGWIGLGLYLVVLFLIFGFGG